MEYKKYIGEGLLYSQTHPTFPLTVLNYTDRVQWEGLWDEVTLQCRGLVVDNLTGEVVARPFKKFFNLSEKRTETTDEFEVFEKLDGSLLVLFNYKGQWIVSSRGSFTSEQAEKGRELLKNYDIANLNKNYTYCFELIYSQNRIVVNYGELEDIFLLGAIDTKTGEDVVTPHPFKEVRRFSLKTPLNEIQNTISSDEEGYVLRFSNGERCKIKGEEYIRLHKIMSDMSTTSVWECLSKGNDITSILNNVPDEYFDKIKEYSKNLQNRFEFRKTWLEIEYLTKYKNIPTSKELSEIIKDLEYKHFVFSLYNGKDITESVWKSIKPKFEKL